MVSDIFDPDAWEPVTDEFDDITYHRGVDVPVVRIAFDRPEVRNAFRPGTVDELYAALDHARKQADVGCVLLTGNGPSEKDGGWAFCSGGDQSVRAAPATSTVTTTRRATRTTRSSRKPGRVDSTSSKSNG